MKGEQLMENLDKITPAAPAAAKQKREKKTSPVMWKNLGVLFHINLKLAFKNKSGMSLGIVWVLIYAIFTIIGAFVPTSFAVILLAIRIIVCTFFFVVFIALVCAYLFRSQHDKGVHNIELRAGIPSIQTFMMRILVAYVVIASYVSITVVFSLLGLVGPSKSLFVLFQLTPALANFFMGLFFLAIFAAWMSLAKMAAGIVLCIFTGMVMFIAPMINSVVSSLSSFGSNVKIETTKMYKENHVNGASIISEYIYKFLDATEDAGLSGEIIDDDDFLSSVSKQLNDDGKTKVEWFESDFNYNSSSSCYEGDENCSVVPTNTLFDWLIQYGLPLYDTNGQLIGSGDNDGLGGILSAFTDVASSAAANDNAAVSSSAIQSFIEFWSDQSYGDDAEADDFGSFKDSFIDGIDTLGKAKGFTYEHWNQNNNYLKLETLVSNLIDLITYYQGAWEFASTMGSASTGNQIHAPFNINNAASYNDDGISTLSYYGVKYSNELSDNVAKVIKYSNENNEYRALVGALMTGFQDLRDPLFTTGLSVKDIGSSWYEHYDITVTLQQFVNDNLADFVKGLKLSTNVNLLNHFSYIMMGYDSNWAMDGKISQSKSSVIYTKSISQYRDMDWIVDAMGNKSLEELATNDKAKIKTASNTKKYIWNYGGLIAGYMVLIILVIYFGSLIHKRNSLI
jgi:hypothetical protein